MCLRVSVIYVSFFFQAEDGIRDLVRSRGLGDVYKRQMLICSMFLAAFMASVAGILSEITNLDRGEFLTLLLSLIHI